MSMFRCVGAGWGGGVAILYTMNVDYGNLFELITTEISCRCRLVSLDGGTIASFYNFRKLPTNKFPFIVYLLIIIFNIATRIVQLRG